MKKKTKRGNGGFLNHALQSLEKQAAFAYKKWNQLDSKEIVRLAIKKRTQISKEVKYYADGIVHTLTHADLLPNKNKLLREAKRNLEGFVKKIQKSDVASKAINLATHKGNEFLNLLNFPTKKEVAKLNSRLSQLEKRLKTLRPSPRP